MRATTEKEKERDTEREIREIKHRQEQTEKQREEQRETLTAALPLPRPPLAPPPPWRRQSWWPGRWKQIQMETGDAMRWAINVNVNTWQQNKHVCDAKAFRLLSS